MSGLSIRNNLPALKAQRSLANSTQYLQRSYERLATGSRINRASDDAAGLAIADRLRANGRLFQTATRNVNDGFSTLTIMGSTLANQTSIVTRMMELAEQSANGTFSATQRRSLNNEYQALVREFGRIGDTTAFNGLNLLSNGINPLDIALQVGINGSSGSRITIQGISSGSFSGTIDFNSLQGAALSDSATMAELSAYYGGNIASATITDSSGARRDVLIAVTMGDRVNGVLRPVFNIYQRVSDTGNAGATTAAGSMGQILSNSHEWVLGQQITPGSLTSNGQIDAFANLNLTFRGGVQGSTSLDIRQLKFSSGFTQYAALQQSIYQLIEDQSGVAVDDLYADMDINEIDDSLGLAELLLDIEDTVGLDFADEEFQQFRTIGEGVKYIYSLLNHPTSGTTTAIDFTNVLDADQARNALTVTRARLAELGQQQGQIGAYQSRLESALGLLGVSREATLQAESRIRDIDVAAESAQLISSQLLQQAATQVLSMARTQPELALVLLSNV